MNHGITPLKAWLIMRQMSQAEFSRRTGIHESRISRLCGGSVQPSPDEISRIMTATGRELTFDDLYRGSEQCKKNTAA